MITFSFSDVTSFSFDQLKRNPLMWANSTFVAISAFDTASTYLFVKKTELDETGKHSSIWKREKAPLRFT